MTVLEFHAARMLAFGAMAILLAVPPAVFFAVAAAATILFVRLIADACTMPYAEYA